MGNGISKKNYRRPTERGRRDFGWPTLPDDLARELGQLFAEWGFVEAQMDALLSATVGNAAIGRALREELKTSRQRRAVTQRLIQAVTPDDLKQAVQMLIGDFNKIAEERGLYAHSQWGTHTAYPGEGVMLMGLSTLEALYPDIEEIIAGKQKDFGAQVDANTALVSVGDVQRCRTALRRLSDKLSHTVADLMMRSARERIKSEAALAQALSVSAETKIPQAPDAQSG